MKDKYIKNFDSWAREKKQIDGFGPHHQIKDGNHKVSISTGEIRWAQLGVNIGSEIDGKGIAFARPILIIKVFGSKLAFIIPVSTKENKDKFGYVSLEIGETKSACLIQSRIISQKRIGSRLHTISDNSLKNIKLKLAEIIEINI